MTTERERFEAWLLTRYPDREDRQSEYRLTSVRDLMFEAYRAALSAPSGYVMVPVEPTPEMVAADLASAICHNQSYAGRPMEVADLLAGIRACWSAMIAAAPKEPT